MSDNEACRLKSPTRTPWNKGKLMGAKPPLRPKHVWSIRTRLMVDGRVRDLAMFNLAIDSKLRGCEVVALKVEDVAPNGYPVERATIRQRKTGQPVKFELSEQTRQAIEDYLRASGKKPGDLLFTSRRHSGRFDMLCPSVSTRFGPIADIFVEYAEPACLHCSALPEATR